MISMEVLDKVYNTFQNLDRDFSRSKKSRADFIVDKFGGDIDIGSMIILEAISASSGDETPEDIKKLSFIKDIFEKLKANRDNLDALPDFSFTTGTAYMDFIQLLKNSVASGTGIQEVSQFEMHRLNRGNVHYSVSMDKTIVAPLTVSKVVHVYNEHMQNYMASKFHVQVELDKYYQIKSALNVVEVPKERLSKALK